ncbi:MAG: hypothetical protein HRT52_04095 [Colwellia sp.]|nr:hypothetical protein [Colwellia sp.]
MSITSLLKRFSLAFFIISLLSACGGGGGADKSLPPQPIIPKTYTLTGGGVKGPLVNAKVSLYAYDQNSENGYGALVAQGITNEQARITGIEITGELASHYILAIEATSETIDLSTQTTPIIKNLRTIITAAEISSGRSFYASPLSSLTLEVVLQKALTDQSIDQAIDEAQSLIKSLFGLGVNQDTNLFNSPSLLVEDATTFEQQAEIFQLRKAIEVFSTLTYQLHSQINVVDLSIDDLIKNFAIDALDGSFDGKNNVEKQLPYTNNDLTLFQQPINNLIIENSNGVHISELNSVLIQEAKLLVDNDLDTEQFKIDRQLNNHDRLILVEDIDNDGINNDIDNDDDNDNTEDSLDAFPLDINEWLDTDLDGIGNNQDLDDDNDGIADLIDLFPLDPNESKDFDGDNIGDNADTDDDNDGFLDINDVFPFDPTESVDTDNDGLGNNIDTDDDNDQVLDQFDAFPLDASESQDSDNDGVGNNRDLDDDNDGTIDTLDHFPFDPTESMDTDQDGIGNNADTDDDNDGVADGLDIFPLDSTEHADSDADGLGNNADPDDDNDGVNDNEDTFPFDPTESGDNDNDGIGNNEDNDDDNDGVLDNDDALPFDSTESVDTDLDGIGDNADTDDDNDTILDEDDAFPLDPNEWLDTDLDGIGNNADSDDDNDGVYDNDDELPLDPTDSVDFDKDGIGDTADNDDDNDGISDYNDHIHVSPLATSSISQKESLTFRVRGFYPENSPLNADDKWHVQYYIYDANLDGKQVPFYTENGYYNATFNHAKMEWQVNFPAPDYSGEFEIEFTLYCSSGSKTCGDHDNVYVQWEQKIPFTISCVTTPCGYQPKVEPGINISASKEMNQLTASVVRDNGDIIATYIEQAENNWQNYVVKSTNNGISWSRIGKLPEYVLDGQMLEISTSKELLFIGKCTNKNICTYKSTDAINWTRQDLFDTSNFGHCSSNSCDTNYMSISSIAEDDDGSIIVIFNNRKGDKDISFLTKSYDLVNWSIPMTVFGNEFTTKVQDFIKLEGKGYAAAVLSYQDYNTSILISDDAVEWQSIQAIPLVVAADLIYQNGILRLFHQSGLFIFESSSSDLLNFSTPNKVVEKSYIGFDTLPINNGNFGVLYNLLLNYQHDIFYEDLNISTP